MMIIAAAIVSFFAGVFGEKLHLMEQNKSSALGQPLLSNYYSGPLKTNCPSSFYSEVLVTNWHDLPPDGPFLMQYGTVKKELWQDSSWDGGKRHELMEIAVVAQLPPRVCELRTNEFQGVVEKVVVGTGDMIQWKWWNNTNWWNERNVRFSDGHQDWHMVWTGQMLQFWNP